LKTRAWISLRKSPFAYRSNSKDFRSRNSSAGFQALSAAFRDPTPATRYRFRIRQPQNGWAVAG
jgi:hypothetical protein